MIYCYFIPNAFDLASGACCLAPPLPGRVATSPILLGRAYASQAPTGACRRVPAQCLGAHRCVLHSHIPAPPWARRHISGACHCVLDPPGARRRVPAPSGCADASVPAPTGACRDVPAPPGACHLLLGCTSTSQLLLGHVAATPLLLFPPRLSQLLLGRAASCLRLLRRVASYWGASP